MEQHRAPITVNDTLAWMSDLIIGPILTSLPRPPSAAAPTQISWCPTGLLSFLPLHAAAADLVVSSYTPTLGALLAAQARPRRTPPAPFIIDVSALPDALLTVAAKEVAVLEPMFPGARVGRSASRAVAREALANQPWIHFAGHHRGGPARRRLPARGRHPVDGERPHRGGGV